MLNKMRAMGNRNPDLLETKDRYMRSTANLLLFVDRLEKN
jgi:hypothetical protein